MDSMIPLLFSAAGFILAMASRPGCVIARVFDGFFAWVSKFL